MVNEKKIKGNKVKEERLENEKAKAKAVKDAAEDALWAKGAKSNQKEIEAQAKKAELERKKQEREQILAAEEAEFSKKKPLQRQEKGKFNVTITEEYSATGIDDALDLLNLTGKQPSDNVDRHPERRVKSAYAEFVERETPILKAENPLLRLSQLKQALQKKWKKSPDNPMNQVHASYNTSAADLKELSQAYRDAELEKFKK